MKSNDSPVALITGAAKRIGNEITKVLHSEGYNVVIHYRRSESSARSLCAGLNLARKDSAIILKADLNHFSEIGSLIEDATAKWRRLDVLVNNASEFFPTPTHEINEKSWEQLISSNLKAPYFLSLEAAKFLNDSYGCIINLADIHGKTPLREYPIYSITKAGLNMLTKALAKEFAPKIRVNAIAPGPTLFSNEEKQLTLLQHDLIQKTTLHQLSLAKDIAEGVVFVIQQKRMTGQIIAIDAGRSLRM